jgi:SAM-dependent methyltransferase
VQFNDNPEYSGADILSEIDSNLVNYSRQIVGRFLMFSEISGKDSPRILDFGAGAGSLTEIWREVSNTSPDCIELDPILRMKLQEKGFTAFANLAEINGTYDFIYSSNVLEHIDNDEEVLAQLTTMLSPQGVLGVYVPAFPSLFTDFDKAVGHFRRYRRNELNKKIQNAGARVISSSYCDSVGFFSLAILKFFKFNFNRNPAAPKLMKFYDKFLLPISNLLDWAGFRYLLGKNLLVIARKN